MKKKQSKPSKIYEKLSIMFRKKKMVREIECDIMEFVLFRIRV